MSSRILLWVSLYVSIPVCMFMVLTCLIMSSQAVALSVPFAVALVGLPIWLARRSRLWPRPESDQRLWVIASLLWGGGACMALVTSTADAPMDLSMKMGWEGALMSFGGAWPEEAAKALGVVIMALGCHCVTRPWHVMLTGFLVGLGFEVVENLLYASSGALIHPTSDLLGAMQMWGLRLAFGLLLHAVWSALVGWGLGWALLAAQRSIQWRLGAAASGWAAGFGGHFLWNYIVEPMWLAIAWYCLVGPMIYGAFVWVVIQARRLERSSGEYVVDKPILAYTPADYPRP